ncbi:hypothetical protein DPMN_050723 [Dreissena polymorpha]|uniref:Uncharacterized protein n=1 Tax=Dreissena polymorpha TaxID=45954 RepID=A0A9D4CIM5_DREPO|nr:hypothetical protein DPMN_050723 [Dreissena polymorpha]
MKIRHWLEQITKNAPPPGSHVFQPTCIIFELVQDIIRMNLLTKFHEDRTVNVASRVLTRFYYSHIRKIVPPIGSHVFQANIIIFTLIQDIIETNLLTKFHEDWTINVAPRVFTRKNAPSPGGHVFKPTKTIFELIQDIIATNLLTKFHDVLTRKNALPPWWPCFSTNRNIFELVQDIIEMNLLTEFHEDQTINVSSREKFPATWQPCFSPPHPGGHVFPPTGIIIELVQDIIVINLLTKKNAPPLGSHVFQANVTIFELIQDIIETNLLTEFHDNWTINVASRELTSQMLTLHNARRTKGDHMS